MVMLKMSRGTLVHVNSSFRAAYGYDQRIEAFGERGMLVSGNQRPTTLERHGKSGTRFEPLMHFFIDRYAQSYRSELAEFIAALTAGTPPSIGIDDGRRALMIAEAGVRSAKTGIPVGLKV
jgi:myo-inositol 2-dehydrogenase/D-chiro-inositol 1-dehydrogenase